MPSVKKGESRESYLKRAIPMIKKEHRISHKAAIGKAQGMYDAKWQQKKWPNE